MSKTLEAFGEYREAVNRELAAALDQFPKRLGVELSIPVQTALGRLRDYCLQGGGKRVRGSLAAATYDEAAGTHLGRPGMQLGAALELMQNYLLIIDDVMDKSALRRGEPTVHELYLQQADPKVGLHEAQMMAVNIGLVVQHMASLVVADLRAPAGAVQRVTQLMHANIMTTGIGQMDDLYQQLGRDVSTSDIMRKYECKSSYYTFINPLQCGFALAGKATPEVLESCRRFGLPAGVAFQLRDDCLGIFADTGVLGKPNLDDIREGKYTLLVAQALKRASAADKRQLKRILGSSKADERDLMIVRNILERSGAKTQVEAATAEAAAAAGQALESANWSKNFSTLLRELVAFSIARQA